MARVPYAELHARSHFSFLSGSSSPAELVAEAVRLEIDTLALTDLNGFYGVVEFAQAAVDVSLNTVFGADVSLSDTASRGDGRSEAGDNFVVLARDPQGYAALGTMLSAAHMAGAKRAPKLTFNQFLAACADAAGHWAVLTASTESRVAAHLASAAGRDNVFVELVDHGNPLDSQRNDALAALAAEHNIGIVCANDVRFATTSHWHLAACFDAIAHRRTLAAHDGWLASNSSAHLRSGAEQQRRFARWPGAVETATALGHACAFDLRLVAPNLPPFPTPDDSSEMTYLRRLTTQCANARYGDPHEAPDAHKAVAHELDVIDQLGFAGYFLLVHDLVSFCRSRDIYCQGRGSAANSAVCYVLGITHVDAVGMGLLFERFLSPHRDGPPDIDLDIESGRREEVIQYVYDRYGRTHTAQVANVISYRRRSALRDISKVLERPPTDELVTQLADQAQHAPRHLGIHSGGMVICDRPLAQVCPTEWATKSDRSVLQWDKDSCAGAGLVKFDLLGLGMLSALHIAVDLVAVAHDTIIDLGKLPQDPAVYDMLCAADTIGVFQVESRAQMSTLPRLRPRNFYDLVVEVGIIRPGPIQGGSVHPYIRRRHGREPVTYPHPLLEPVLSKTLGVPLFQEQLMAMAIEVAGFSPAEADRLRVAMGAKRSRERMAPIRQRLIDGMAQRNISAQVAEDIWNKMEAFATYGFPESHAASFAHLVYASAYIKHHYPAAFCAALLNAQPMGFYSPHTLVGDARRHGVEVATPNINASAEVATLEPDETSAGGVRVRLSLASVRGVGTALAAAIADAAPFDSIEQLVRAVPQLSLAQLEALAAADVFGCLGLDRREALWAVGIAHRSSPSQLGGLFSTKAPDELDRATPSERAADDLWATGIAVDGHPTVFVRDELANAGVVCADTLRARPQGRVTVAGIVTHRQRPPTAGGITFMSLEDETGLVNVVIHRGCWLHFRHVMYSGALVVRGRLERHDGAVNLVADKITPIDEVVSVPAAFGGAPTARNFR